MKEWKVENKVEIKTQKSLIGILLKNRGITSKKEIKDFLNPNLSLVTPKFVKISDHQLKKAVLRIKKAIKDKQKIIIYADYDVDGICAAAILWETLNSLKANVLPFIPSRFEEGYGLSKEGIDNLIKKDKPDLIITVDNGIVANKAVEYARQKGIEVIVTDHHVPSDELPNAFAIVHTAQLCGTGVAYMLAQAISKSDKYLDLVALATIADLVPLKLANRILVHFGILDLRKTKRLGLNSLIEKARIKKEEVGVYEIGHIIAPRLNAMGRISSAMDSLRLVCTINKKRADELAELLSTTNFERQKTTIETIENAKVRVDKKQIKNLIFIADESYQQGIIGLVAGRLVEEYYFPSIVISKGEKFSKASARSVKGFNIIEFLRTASDLLVDVGGHPMAAGFTVETDKIDLLEKKLYEEAEKLLKKDHLKRSLRIDTVLPADFININTYESLQSLSPFGMANPEPTFLTEKLIVEDIRFVGIENKHLKIRFMVDSSGFMVEGIAFGMGEKNKLKVGDTVDVVYTLSENIWNGNSKMELKIKDIKKA